MYWHACTVPFLFFIFLEELVLRVLHVLPNKPSNLKPNKTMKAKLFWKYPFWKNMKKSEIKPIKPIWKNPNRSTHQTHMKPKPNQTHEQLYPSTTTNQPIHHHWVPINPSNPQLINPSTTTEFPNQETKTLVLHKTKLHGRKREEALPRAHRRERERDVYWEWSEINKLKK